MIALGEEIASFLADARERVLIVAPFIKAKALELLLERIPPSVETEIVTRWHPADIVAGASDLEVFNLTKNKQIPLYLRQDLHAKLFARDNQCLVGSANVTFAALGWNSSTSNLELIFPVCRMSERIREFEQELLAGRVSATQAKYDQLRQLIRDISLPQDFKRKYWGSENEIHQLPSNWIPQSRTPEDLYSVYCGNQDFSRSGLELMRLELSQMRIIEGLDEVGFKAWVASAIQQTPLIDSVINHIEKHGELTELELQKIFSRIAVGAKPQKTAKVIEALERWLTFFLPAQYQTTRDSIKLIRTKSV